MIINLVGPPAAGKSTFAARFVLEHPEFKFCSIDAYRIAHKQEDKAWQALLHDMLENKNVVLESAGLSWRLPGILNTETLRRRKLVTIGFVGEIPVIKERLKERQKRPVPFPYKDIDELAAVDYVSEHISEIPMDYMIDVTHKDPIVQYEELCQFIARKRIEALSDKGRRWYNGKDYLRSHTQEI